MVILSGPEPQRTVLENIVMEQLKTVPYKSLVVRGIPEKNQHIKFSESITAVSSLESEALNRAMLASDIILSRPGYSTLMDLEMLGKRAIFIPTPGQTEQEYLAANLLQKGTVYSHQQENFILVEALEKAKQYPGFSERKSDISTLKVHLEELIARVQEKPSTTVQ